MYKSAIALNTRKSADRDVVRLSQSKDWIQALLSTPVLIFWVWRPAIVVHSAPKYLGLGLQARACRKMESLVSEDPKQM